MKVVVTLIVFNVAFLCYTILGVIIVATQFR